MRERPAIEYVHEGRLVAEVDVMLLEGDHAWAPFLSAEDAAKLELVRHALRRGDVKAAAGLARVFELVPVAGE